MTEFFLIAIVALGLVIWGAFHAHQKRQNLLTEWADRHRWQRLPDDNRPHNTWRGTPFSPSNSSPRIKERLYGEVNGWRTSSFQYQYEVRHSNGQTTSSSTHYFHVIAVELPAAMPMLELTRETVGTRIGKVFGSQDIQFESEDFNRAWHVRAEDRRFAFDVIRPQTMELLMSQPYLGLPWRIDGNTIVTWHSGKQNLDRIFPEALRLISLLNTIPPFVWDNVGYSRDGHY